MARKQVLKITPILVTLNVIVLLIIVGFYSHRLVKYYLKENGNKNEENVSFLVNEIKKKQSMLDDTKGLVLDEETGIYTYKGEVDDNYVYYSGMMYRILNINEEDNIKLASEDSVTLIYPGFEKGFEESYVIKWLNSSEKDYSGIYEKSLVKGNIYLDNTRYCLDTIDDLNNITCDDINEDYKITMLSLYDYKQTGGKSGFLNNGEMFNLGSLNKDNQNYYVTGDGEIALSSKNSRAITIKPVITINSETEYIGGNGKKNNPYVIEKHEINSLADVYVNSVIKIDDYNYKVTEVTDNSVKVAMMGVIKKGEDDLKISFGGSDSSYTTKNTVGKYLNGEFLKSISLKDYIVNSNYYIGMISLTNQDYTQAYKNKVKAKVGIMTIGEMFINDISNTFTLLRGIEGNNIINVINENGYLFADTISSKYSVRPTFYLNNKLVIKDGSGTIESPYELGVQDATEKKEE